MARIENIPVLLYDTERQIGRGFVDDEGCIRIKVDIGAITKELEALITINQIRFISLGFGYTLAPYMHKEQHDGV